MITPYKGRTLEVGQCVDVYRNLHNGMFSIRDQKTKLVLAHGDEFILTNVYSLISRAGQRKTREQGVRNVHAWLAGKYLGERDIKIHSEIRYNPYLNDDFLIGEEVMGQLDAVLFYDRKCFQCELREDMT